MQNDRIPISYRVSLPSWAEAELSDAPTHLLEPEAQMQWIIRWSRLNVEQATGGPFAAGVFTRNSGRLIAVGVNRVVAESNATAHAEIVAISLAQQAIQSWNLDALREEGGCRLVVNAQPCSMCFGAVIWSGVRELIFAVDKTTVQQITGFDEGPLPDDWQQALLTRGIQVVSSIGTAEAAEVLKAYVESGQPIYNADRGKR